jgi:hypothetical protein
VVLGPEPIDYLILSISACRLAGGLANHGWFDVVTRIFPSPLSVSSLKQHLSPPTETLHSIHPPPHQRTCSPPAPSRSRCAASPSPPLASPALPAPSRSPPSGPSRPRLRASRRFLRRSGNLSTVTPPTNPTQPTSPEAEC